MTVSVQYFFLALFLVSSSVLAQFRKQGPSVTQVGSVPVCTAMSFRGEACCSGGLLTPPGRSGLPAEIPELQFSNSVSPEKGKVVPFSNLFQFKPCYRVIRLLWFRAQHNTESSGPNPNSLPFPLEIWQHSGLNISVHSCQHLCISSFM